MILLDIPLIFREMELTKCDSLPIINIISN